MGTLDEHHWGISASAINGIVLTSSFTLAWMLSGVEQRTGGRVDPTHLAMWQGLLLYVGIWHAALALNGAYRSRNLGSGSEEFRAVAIGALSATFVVAAVCFFARAPFARSFVLVGGLLSAVLLGLDRYVVRRLIRRHRLRGKLQRRVLAVGGPGTIATLSTVLDREAHLGYEIVACVPTRPVNGVELSIPAPVVGSIDSIGLTCSEHDIDTVMVTAGADVSLRDLAWALEAHDVELIAIPHLADVSASRLGMRAVAGLTLLHVDLPQASRSRRWPKRMFDLVGSSLLLTLFAPLILVISVLIKLGDRGPLFYKQKRVGLHGHVFNCWKFRSMSKDAEAIDAELRASHGYIEGIFKIEDDPRVTRIGRFIRGWSIDELPQLFNVIAGDMSLVGPRPHLPAEVDTFSEAARRRLHVRPGMTGLWQVSGRSNLSWTEAVRLDLSYRDNWSFTWDLLIIAKTIRAVLRQDGAY